MRYSYEFKRKCVEMYYRGEYPDTPEGISTDRFHDKVREWVRIEEACGPGASVKKIKMTAPTVKEFLCEKCGNRIRPNSKGRRYMNLKHRSMGVILSEINVGYNRYTCPVCSHYWKEDVPFKVKGHMMTLPALNALLFHFMENTAMAVMARLTGISAPTVYRLFYDNIEVPHRTYHLPSVLSIDEFRATSDEGTIAFHITNPITGKTLDIVSDRTMSTLLDYFSRFSHEQKKKVKIVVMDLSGAFNKIIRKIFPNAKQVADKFHYVKVLRQNMTDARVRCMKRMDRKDPLYRVMKKNIHLFDQYHSSLNNEKAWMRGCFRNERTGKLLELTNSDLVEMIMDCEECADFKPAYDLYQEFLAILRSLTYTAYYRRNGITYKTSFNNGFCESQNNKVKLVKRNAFGYRYFINLRKRILLHLGFRYTLNFEETKKG